LIPTDRKEDFKMRYLKVGSFFLCLVIIGFSFFASSAYGQVKPIDLSYSTFFPANHKHGVLSMEWAREIEKRTNGKVKITLHYGGTLTPAEQIYDGVVKKISDLGMCITTYSRGRFPLTEVMDLPLPRRTSLIHTKMLNEYYAKFKPKEFDDAKPMYFYGHGASYVHTKKPVYKLEDLKGMKLRTPGQVSKVAAALGAVPVAMSMGDSYDALRRGVVDGTIAPYETLQNYKLGEVVKFTTEVEHVSFGTPIFVVMNKGVWNTLPPDIQKIIEQLNGEYSDKHAKAFDEINEAGKDFVLKLGNKVITLSVDENRRWERAVQPLYDEYVKSMKDKGLPGDEAVRFTLETIYRLKKENMKKGKE
jgi:TRAP-type C4-dicarboxylate transport system substrate-binding protein